MLPTEQLIQYVEAVANKSPEFTKLTAQGYTTPDRKKMEEILANPIVQLEPILNASLTSLVAKQNLSAFFKDILDMQDQTTDFDTMFQYTTDFEHAILNSQAINDRDKKTVLSATSVVRYDLYFATKHKRKPRDRDWDISIGQFIVATDGASAGSAEAIVASVTANLINNK